jgi:hypothetical protein
MAVTIVQDWKDPELDGGIIKISTGVEIVWGNYKDCFHYRTRESALNAAELWCDLCNGIAVPIKNAQPAIERLKHLQKSLNLGRYLDGEISAVIQLLKS